MLTVEEFAAPEIQAETISGSFRGSCGLNTAGYAFCWGSRSLGNGESSSDSPVAVTMPESVTFASISVGHHHTVALSKEGAAYAWGSGSWGQLGNGKNTSSQTPIPVTMPEGVRFIAISAGYHFTVALTTSGEAYAWGVNGYGQLGDGTNTDSNTPVKVEKPEWISFTSISAHSSHALALTETGFAYAWGRNHKGQLGYGGTSNSNTPVPVRMPTDVSFASLDAGGSHSVALSTTGAAYAWGYNNLGQLGNGTTTDSRTPVAVRMPTGVSLVSISAGSSHNLALSSTGAAYGWGFNRYGQVGNGSYTYTLTEPVELSVPAGVSFIVINAANLHSLAVSSSGDGYSWGYNYYYELGDLSQDNRNIPGAISGGIAFGK